MSKRYSCYLLVRLYVQKRLILMKLFFLLRNIILKILLSKRGINYVVNWIIFKLRINNPKQSEVSTLFDLCKTLVECQKNNMYKLVERVCRLILTLPVSTATTERGFSAMKIFKNHLRNKMSVRYLANNMVIYIEKEIAVNFDSESIIGEFKNLKGRRAEL
ncbi:putative HAT dimerization domain-containing protein [Helianthus annuus]|nr:putative HAT dimerization domain-containing protein [Helianthus annuus]